VTRDEVAQLPLGPVYGCADSPELQVPYEVVCLRRLFQRHVVPAIDGLRLRPVCSHSH
jgi:hypothetical protein